ncbi:MAG: response regulator transcription factor [Roseburia sp.]|nr:response regulator transcription factor [Roseburia sp.]
MFNILVVEDNTDMRELFCTVLSDSGYRCLPATDGLAALEVMDKEYIDLIVADIMMPGMDGYELTKTLRDSKCEIPILMVTAKDQFEDMQRGFRAGTDDYMIKPVNVKELVLRVEALLRRAKISGDKKIVVGSTVLDYDALTVTIHGKETILPQKEFYLLYKLLSYPNKIFTRPQLMDEIWGMFSETDERTVNTHINRLRDRFADCSDFEIVTVRGLGYKAVKKVE